VEAQQCVKLTSTNCPCGLNLESKLQQLNNHNTFFPFAFALQQTVQVTSGGHSILVPPLPIPNRTVKQNRANDSRLLARESRSPPDSPFNSPHGISGEGCSIFLLAVFHQVAGDLVRGSHCAGIRIIDLASSICLRAARVEMAATRRAGRRRGFSRQVDDLFAALQIWCWHG
jgi:hypothetical protein